MYSTKLLLTVPIAMILSAGVAGAQIYPYAGTGVAGSAGIGGDSRQLQLNNPVGLASDGSNGFIADYGNNRVVMVASGSFTATVYAGTGQAASSGDGGPANLASLNAPVGLAMDEYHNLYISELFGCRIRKVDAVTGIITTIAGTGSTSSSGDGGPATAAGIAGPAGLAYDSGVLYVVEYMGHTLRRIDLSTGTIVTLARSSYGSPFSNPMWAAVEDPINGVKHVLVSDMGSHEILRVDPTNGQITAFAGNGNVGFTGDGVQALNTGMGSSSLTIFNDQVGGLYIADAALSRIRKVSRDTGIIETVAGNGFSQPTTTGGDATKSPLQAPQHVMALSNGFTLFSDGNNRVWQLVLPPQNSYPYTATTASTNPAVPNSGQSMSFIATVSPIGTTGVPSGSVAFLDSLGNVIGTAPVVAGTATLSTTAPAAAGTYSITAAYSGDSVFYASTSPAIQVVVQNANKAATTTYLSGPQVPGASPATFNVTVTANGGTGAPITGTIQLLDGANVVATQTLQNGSALVTVYLAGTGPHTITAVYSGDSNYLGSTSNAVSDQIKLQSTGYITTSVNPSAAGAPVTFTATIYQSGATGTVEFDDRPSPSGNPVPLATVPVSNNQAVWTTSSLSAGTHIITASYSGDSTYVGFTTSYISQVVNLTATTTALTSSQNPVPPGVAVTFPVTITPTSNPGVQPTGSVQLLDGTTVITSANVVNGGAQLSYTFGTWGTHSLTAVYSGDANFQGSTSAVLNQSVKSTSSVALNSTPNPSTDGATVTFTAIVQQSAATGTIDLMDGATVLGSTTTGSGSAVFAVALAAGTHTITANYRGDSNFQPSSTTLTQVVKANTTTTLAANPSTATVGQAVQFTATVAPTAATGSVQFFEGGTLLGTISVNSGVAVLSISTFTAGTHNVNCLYSGDSGYASSSSSYAGVVVSKIAASITVASSVNPSVAGQAVTLTATVAPAAATGTVQFLDGATVLGTAPLSGGVATFSSGSLAAGTHSITASYSGDSTYNTASGTLTQTVQAATVTALSANPPSATVGQAVQLTATVTPGTATGTVQFLDGGAVLGSAALSGGTASISVTALTAGNHSITAAYSGDSNDVGSASSAVAVAISKAAATVGIVSSPNPSVSGKGVTFTATVAPGAATGTVQFLDGATVLGTAPLSGGIASFGTAALAAGTHTISVVYSGDSTYNTASGSLTQVVQAIPVTTVSANPASANVGQAVQLTATVTPPTATGTVQFLDGNAVLGSAALSGGTASVSVSTFAAGTHSITAAYSGDANDVGSSSTAIAVTISKLTAAVAVVSSPNPAVSGQSVTFSATVSPAAATGTVQFLDGAAVLGTVAVSGGTASFTTGSLAAGNHTITASYSGNATYSAASASIAQVVQAVTTTSVTSNQATAIFGQTVQFTAVVTPATATGTVQFRDNSNTILGSANVNGGMAVFSTSALAVGIHPITALYSGDSLDLGSMSPVYNQTIILPPPNAPSNLSANTVSPSQIALAWTASTTGGVTYTVYASTTAGFTPSAANRIATVNQTNYAVKGLNRGTTYYFVVTAKNNNGESTPSNQASATTKP